MNVLGLVSFCKLKDKVREYKHIYSKQYIHSGIEEKMFKAVIQSRGYEATLRYKTYSDGRVVLEKSTLVDCKDLRVFDDMPIEKLVVRLLGPKA